MPRIPPEQLINTLFGPPKAKESKKLADFAAKSIPKPEKPPSMEAERFVVHDALNPYREALLESGVVGIDKNPLSAEKKDREINLLEILASDMDSYRQSGLVSWAEALDQVKADLANLTPDKLKIIEQEIKAGAIPIFMPGKAVQLATTVDHFLVEDHAAELVEGVPEKSYISLQKPTQNPDVRATNKTVPDQLKEFKKIVTEWTKANSTAKNPAIHIQNPAEYGALQMLSTKRLKEIFTTNNLSPQTLNPIDVQTFTRFINLPLSTDRGVPNASFNPGSSRLGWGRGDADSPSPKFGFRLSVRVEI